MAAFFALQQSGMRKSAERMMRCCDLYRRPKTHPHETLRTALPSLHCRSPAMLAHSGGKVQLDGGDRPRCRRYRQVLWQGGVCRPSVVRSSGPGSNADKRDSVDWRQPTGDQSGLCLRAL